MKKKKNSAMKKLIPATSMLLVSATMLTASTYAWFTMSREVEVNNIRLTATVPEDIQLSLGHLKDFTTAGAGDATVATASGFTGLAGNQGILDKADGASNADDGNAKAPLNGNDAVSALDWSSTADISEYYRLGKIIPASSIDGQNIYFTPDADGVGKTLKSGAKYYQAANITTAFTWKTNGADSAYVATGGDTNGDSAKTTLHAINNVTEGSDDWGINGDTTNYKTGTEWNVTNDDGYYVDIPIWFRSSAQSELTLAVDAYVTTTQAKDDDDLYLAARAVILYNSTADSDGGYTTAPTTGNTSKLLRIRQDNFAGNSIVNYMYSTNSTGDAVNSTAGAYADALEYMGYPYLKVAAGTNNGYGPMTKAIVRVWLEGEDPNCWNTNAGQDFAISLKFTKDNLSGAIGDTLPGGVTAGDGTYPTTAINHTSEVAGAGQYGADSSTQSLKAGARVWVTSTTNFGTSAEPNNKVDELQFEYNGSKWSLVTDGSFHKYEGYNYTFNSQSITTSDDIATQLLSLVTKLSDVEAHDTVGEAFTVTVANAT